ncbi:MAG: hypothetical protein IT438_02335 [Phycisphaerales bacterium]|nr:hypothetical protein [Phycisphaerales bacterium]
MTDITPSDRGRASDELYVGYLRVPRRQKVFLRWAVPTTLWIACGLSFVWARSQHSPGEGTWDTLKPMTLRGVIVARPYPILFTRGVDGEMGAVLLVEMGKRGLGERAVAFDSKTVEVTGWPLERDGRRMLEIEPVESAVVAVAGEVVDAPRVERLGRVALRGEIVDSKCYLGAMKPGEGKTHKECATLCIRGGIPPMLVTGDAGGGRVYYLLRDAAGGPIDPALHALIADPVEVRGELASWGGLRVLSVRAEDVRRL